VRFQFADPALEQLSAGQKIMLRVVPDNQRRLRNRLAQIRAQLTAPR
jgi:flagellar biosynthesis/type III secretory pathway protein FliH